MPRRTKLGYPKFASRLSTMRKGGRLTMTALANRTGLSISYISELEKGWREPSSSTVNKLASALNDRRRTLELTLLEDTLDYLYDKMRFVRVSMAVISEDAHG